ncbi:MAG TPA: hypothetical protein VEK34_00500 [Methylocella sp.]|nr:hypothetical protein [Methylocella sp.]
MDLSSVLMVNANKTTTLSDFEGGSGPPDANRGDSAPPGRFQELFLSPVQRWTLAISLFGVCFAALAPPAAAKPKRPLVCDHYSDCLKNLAPYCRKDSASETKEHRAEAYKACAERYRATCREVHCD